MTVGAELRPSIAEVVLLRLFAAGAEGVTRSALSRDLYALVAHRLSPAEWRADLDQLVTEAITAGDIATEGKRLLLTEDGGIACERFYGGRLPKVSGWADLKNTVLVAKALGVEKRPKRQLKRLNNAPGLRLSILERSFKLRFKGAPSLAKARTQLAREATRRRPALASAVNGSVPRKDESERQLAAGLLTRARPASSDGELVSLLAAEQVGAIQTDVSALRLALLRRYVAGQARSRTVKAPSAQEILGYDVARFAAEILKIARSEARGVPGSRKAYIADVWKRLTPAGAPSPDSHAQFKTLLVEAHRLGLLSLTNADLRDKANMQHVQDSAVTYQNTVWHLIRVEDI
ncbi:MAG: hypothetical protein R3D57_18575 [Hyphomicrobiaceae bacterium]